MMKREIELVLCHEKDGHCDYWMYTHVTDSFIINFDMLDLHVIRHRFPDGNIYLIGYLFEGKFFDQLCYLGKGVE